MNLQELRQRPILIHILTLLCLLFTLNLVFTTLKSFGRTDENAGLAFYFLRFLPLIVWLATCAGFIKLKRWAWGLFLGFLFFSVFNFMRLLISQQMEIHLRAILFIIINLVLIWLLNRDTVRNAFKVGMVKNKHLPASLINFAVFLTFAGFFLFIEILARNRITSSAFAAKLFVSSLGLVFMLLGIGIWQAKKIARQSTQPILIFTLLSVTFICVKDFLSAASFYRWWQSLFYILVSVGMFGYWIFFVKKNRH